MKKAQSASGAAAFIAILTVLIILYILFLPPDVRTELLGSGQTTNGTFNNSNTDINTLLQQQIGRITFVNTNQKSYDVPTVRIYSSTSGQLIKAVPNINIKNALFDKEKASYSMDFDIDSSLTQNLLLSFNAQDYSGPLILTLNGREIYNQVIDSASPAPIKLDKGFLTDKNTIIFSVPSPGWAFWKSNQYNLQSVQITGDVTDLKNSQATQYFSVTESDKANLDTIKLIFSPVCKISDAGPLQIRLNGRAIYNSIADCGTKSIATLPNEDIISGSNELIFSTATGSYLLDNIAVQINLKKPAFNTYFFDMSKDFFKTTEERATCGTDDGICPAGCSDTEDGDCCFKHNGFWCALPTSNGNDRCVWFVDANDCGLCKTGYYDNGGQPPKNCEDKCGDNTDDKCLSSCLTPSRYYDQDCCYAANPDNFWCKEVPVTGISDKCRASISTEQCTLCPSGYVNKDGSSPLACNSDIIKHSDTTFDLLDNYDVTFKVRFVDDTTRHIVDFNINGHKISVDTTSIDFERNIDAYVQDGTNTVEIVPKQDIDIAEIRIELQQVK